jgi:GTP-binding protein
MTYWEYEDSARRFQKILEALGIRAALSAAGVQEGDTVIIGEAELEWTD